MKITCIAIDDEPLALDVLEHHAQKIPFLEMTARFSNAFEAMQFLCREKVDLMFLDIQMPQLTGFELLRTLQHKPMVIFTTAYPDYALESYELDAVDYLLKPIPFERFLKAVIKVQQRMLPAQGTIVEAINQASVADFIFVKTDYKTVKISLNDILYIESFKDYVMFHLEKEKVQSLLSIKAVEGFLNKEHFVRVHRSFIVALNKIDAIERTSINIGKHIVPIGDNYKESFKAMVENKRL
jgi:two-component system, LytTR family, response regulator